MKKRRGILFTIIMMALFVVVSCNKPATELAEWSGEWISIGEYAADPTLDGVYETTSQSMPNYTTEGYKDAVLKMYSTPVVKAKFDGTNEVVFTVIKDGNPVDLTCSYLFKEKIEDPVYEGAFWHAFELEKVGKGMSGVKYFVAMPPHSHGDGPAHWHARFGGKSIEYLINSDGWPTFESATLTKEEFISQFEKSIPEMVKYFPKSPFKMYSKNGKMMRRLLAFYENSDLVNASFEKLIKEFAGKNPNGGDFTKEDIISIIEKRYGKAEDFTHFEFITDGGKNELVLYKDDVEVFRSGYKRVAPNPAKENLMAVLADVPNAGKFTTISMTGIHGDPKHMHFWYGENNEAISAFEGVPTGVSANISEEEKAKVVENVGRWVLNKLIEK